MNNNRIYIDKNDFDRIVLTELLPYEVPFIFSSEGFYSHIKRIKKDPTSNHPLLEKILTIKQISKEKHTIPFNYLIRKNDTSFRTLSIMHPRMYFLFINFYKEYSDLLLYHCSKSVFSLRKPHEIINSYYQKEDLDLTINDMVQDSNNASINNASNYYEYKPFPLMFRFFKSYSFLQLEKKFTHFMSLDISKCFYNIYSHSICWAVKNKEYSKINVSAENSFETKFDKIMQLSNYNETNGILVGPEISRIFAEVIFQQIDINIQNKLLKDNLYFNVHYSINRYIDDYFVFTNDLTVTNKINLLLQEELEKYKLYINPSKTKIATHPFVTPKSLANIEIGDFMDELFNRTIKFDYSNDSISIEILKIFRTQEFLNKYIIKLKKCLVSYEVKYNDVSTYILKIFQLKIKKITKYFENNDINSISESELKNLIMSIGIYLDLIFYLYSMDIKVNNTHKVSKIIYYLNNILSKLNPYEYKYFLNKKIFDESINIIRKVSSINSEFSIEVLNLLITIKHLGPEFNIEERKLLDLLNINYKSSETEFKIRSNINYFVIVVLLYYIENNEDYKRLKKGLIKLIGIKLNGCSSSELRKSSESLMLFLDVMSCPYLDFVFKETLIFDNEINKTEAVEYLSNSQWFINWNKDLNLGVLLYKKELKQGYH